MRDWREQLPGLVERVFHAKDMRYAAVMLRTWAKRNCIPHNPVGSDDSKTQVPSTYRPVGPTCPLDCPYLDNGCYAQQANVNIHQGRSSAELEPSFWSAAFAFIIAGRFGTLARLHVSGGFARPDGEVDSGYIYRLCELADWACDYFEVDKVAWSYSHFAPEVFSPYRALLSASGIEVIYSDQLRVGGAIVYPFELVPELRAQTGLKLAKCPAQLSKHVTCRSCGLCWRTREANVCVVFNPHGSGKRAAETASPTIRRSHNGQSMPDRQSPRGYESRGSGAPL